MAEQTRYSTAKGQIKKDVQPKSEGHRLLRALPFTQGVVSKAVGVSTPRVSDWFCGKGTPSQDNRLALQKAFGIPVEEWDRKPVVQVPPKNQSMSLTRKSRDTSGRHPRDMLKTDDAVRRAEADMEGIASQAMIGGVEDKRSALEGVVALIKEIREDRDLAETPADISRMVQAETRALALRAQLERDLSTTEDRFVREHPFWKRIRTTITVALKPYPEAALALAQALDEIDA